MVRNSDAEYGLSLHMQSIGGLDSLSMSGQVNCRSTLFVDRLNEYGTITSRLASLF